jgi:hypothetical protein
MLLSSKKQSRKHNWFLACLVATTLPAQIGFAAEETADKSTTPAAAEPAAAPAPATAPATAVSPAAASESAETKAATQAAAWIYQMRANLGAARYEADAKKFSSDRMGVSLYAGHVATDVLSLGFLPSKEMSLGLSYQSFTGVEAVSDKSWSLQSIGVQARSVFDVGLAGGMDVGANVGLALQVLVGEDQQSRQSNSKYGGALTAAGYVRWPVMDSLLVLGGLDMTAGKASSLALTAGLETHF